MKKVQIIYILPAEKNIDYKGGFFPGKLKHRSNTENIFFWKAKKITYLSIPEKYGPWQYVFFSKDYLSVTPFSEKSTIIFLPLIKFNVRKKGGKKVKDFDPCCLSQVMRSCNILIIFNGLFDVRLWDLTCPSSDLFTSGGRQDMRGKNQYITREHKAPRYSKYLALETFREGKL